MSNAKSGRPIVILGVFVADTAYRAGRQPKIGETIMGSYFKLGPGGKGSNQSVAAGKLGADVSFFTRLGKDAFADMARAAWREVGVKAAVIETPVVAPAPVAGHRGDAEGRDLPALHVADLGDRDGQTRAGAILEAAHHAPPVFQRSRARDLDHDARDAHEHDSSARRQSDCRTSWTS